MKTRLYPKNPKMCDPILVMLLKTRPHYSQSSLENATPLGGSSPLAPYKEVPPGLCLTGKIFRWVRLSSITDPNRSQSYNWSSIGFHNRTVDWLRREYWVTANKGNYSTNVVTRKIAKDRSVFLTAPPSNEIGQILYLSTIPKWNQTILFSIYSKTFSLYWLASTAATYCLKPWWLMSKNICRQKSLRVVVRENRAKC